MTDNWPEQMSKLRRIILRKRAEMKDPVQEIADAIPASRATVYELMAGRIQRPSRAVRQGVERLVEPSTDTVSPGRIDATEAPGDSEV